MLAGSIVIESVFVLPGLGQLLLNAILSRDYTVVQGTVFLFSIIVLVMNLITDISVLDCSSIFGSNSADGTGAAAVYPL